LPTIRIKSAQEKALPIINVVNEALPNFIEEQTDE
jgi:hypothetical protein